MTCHAPFVPLSGYRLATVGETRPAFYQFLDNQGRWNDGHRYGEAVEAYDIIIVPVRTKHRASPIQSARNT